MNFMKQNLRHRASVAHWWSCCVKFFWQFYCQKILTIAKSKWDKADDGVTINKKRAHVEAGDEEDEVNSDDDYRNPKGNTAIKRVRLRNHTSSRLHRYYLELNTFLLVLIRIISFRRNKNRQNHLNDWHQNYSQSNLYSPQVWYLMNVYVLIWLSLFLRSILSIIKAIH